MNLFGPVAIDHDKAHSEHCFGPMDNEALDLATDLQIAGIG
jgi:hypothetical protein